MDLSVKLYSQDFCPTGEGNPFNLIVEESLWKMVHQGEENEGTRRGFLRIFNEEETKEWIAPIGDFVTRHAYTHEELQGLEHSVYMPFWMLDSAGFDGQGEVLKASLLTNDAFPEATKIVLRFIDSAFYNSDLKTELEQSLTKIGVLRKHTTLQIPVVSLGNFPVEVFVSDLEPADCVLCHGDEVVVDFEEPVDQIESNRPPTPVPPTIPTLLANTNLMVPGIPMDTSHGFVPFQGEGRSLGSSNDCIPEWRKNLPPRRP